MHDFSFSRIDPTAIPKYVKSILSKLDEYGFEAYIVGGCVRDLLRGVRPHDWDICSSALPEDIIKIFRRTLPTGIKHGTVTVRHAGGACEVTTFRTDGEYVDHRRPETVVFVRTLREDLSRRDFTMNAIACDIRGCVYDYYGGLEDIKSGTIRCVGDAETRFNEDALRILRAYRFSAQLGFTLDYAITVASGKLEYLCAELSPERVSEELKKLLLSSRPELSRKLIEVGALKRYLGNICSEGAARLKKLPKSYEQRLYALCVLCSVNPSEAARALRLPRAVVNDFIQAENAEFSGSDNTAWKRIVSSHGKKAALYVAAGRSIIGDNAAYRSVKVAVSSGDCLTLSELAFNGSDAAECGFNGKEIGAVLKNLLDYVIQHPDENEKGTLTKLALEMFRH